MNLSLRHLLLVAVFGLSPFAHAEIGGLDDEPAATLLLPYFEVDLDDPQGLTTLFSVTNARQEATLAHVTLWTDLGVPTLDFNFYLTGYDIQTFNVRDLFTTGFIPQTASDGQDPTDSISNQGFFSTDVNFPSCQGQLPLPLLPATLLDHIRAAHTGKASAVVFAGKCSGFNHGDNVARGYLTIDQVDSCTLEFPTDAGYYAAGVLGFDNSLVGDYFYVEADQNFAQGETMVHLEADPSLGASHYTFYRTFSGGADKREGLANVFWARFAQGGAFDGGTDLIAWRDTKTPVTPFTCGPNLPAPFPLRLDQVAIFDEEENVDLPSCPILCPPGVGPEFGFPLASNRSAVNVGNLPAPWNFGAWYLNFNHTPSGGAVPFGTIAQAFVTVVLQANNRFSVGFDAYQLSNVTVPAEATDELLPICDGAPDPPACQ